MHVTVHRPPKGALEAFGKAPCRVFWLDGWERTEALDGLTGGKPWAAVVQSIWGWYAVASRGEVSPSNVARQIAAGTLGRTTAQPPLGLYLPVRQHHVRLWHVERLGIAVREMVAKPGPPAMLVWQPVLEGAMRRPERIWPRGIGAPEGEVDVEQLVQHAYDQKGPWIGAFDALARLPQRELGDWGQLVRVDQVGRGDGQFLPGARHGVSGKGTTSLAATISAVCESVERRCLSQPELSTLAVHEGSVRSLTAAGRRCVDPRALVAFSEEQWHAPDRALHAYFRMPRERLPEPVEDVVLQWVEGTDRHTGEPVLVPRDHVYFHTTKRSRYLLGDSNGASTGSSLDDAWRRGFREVHERAAIACWWEWQVRRPKIPFYTLPDTPEGAWCKQAPAMLAKYGRDVHLLDLTLDPRLPVVVAVALARPHVGAPDPIVGFGCHRTTAQAAARAVGEVIQCGMLDYPQAARLGYTNSAPEAVALSEREADDLGWLYPSGKTLPLDEDHGDGTEEAVCADLYGEGVLVDISQWQDEPPVVKAVVPAAPHFWHRLGCELLYTLPVRFGWLAERPDEAHANELLIAV